jgi:hypothetical protein
MGSDYALAVGPFPPFDPAAAEPRPVHLALASPQGITTKTLAFAAHPAILRVYCAKHPLDHLRLALIK